MKLVTVPLIVAMCKDRGESQALLALVRDHLGAVVDWQWERATLPDGSHFFVAREWCPARSSLLMDCDVLLGTCSEHGEDEGCCAFHERSKSNTANWRPIKDHLRASDAREALLAMRPRWTR